jgi:hypothetical protein
MTTPVRLVTRRQLLGAVVAVAAAPSGAAGAQGDQRMEIMTALERYVSAWQAGDITALVACYHDDFTLHYFGRSALAGDHRGRTAALRVLSEVSRRTNRRLVAVVDVVAGRRRGAVIAREAFQRDGMKAELERVFVYTVRDDRLHECWVYDADQELVDRFLA